MHFQMRQEAIALLDGLKQQRLLHQLVILSALLGYQVIYFYYYFRGYNNMQPNNYVERTYSGLGLDHYKIKVEA